MSIWKKLFGKKKVEKEIIILRLEPTSLAAGVVPLSDKQMELFECFYGTLVDRTEYNETNRYKKKHAHDGWREGHSKPFKFDGETFDVQYCASASLHLYEKLMERVYATIEEL